MRTWLAGVALMLAASAAAKEPTADEALLDWTCSAANLPRLVAPPVALPVAGGWSARPAAATVVYVAADGAETTVDLDGAQGTVVAADRAAPTAAVVDVVLRSPGPVHVAFGPAGSVEAPPIGPELVAAMGRMCPGGQLIGAGLGAVSSRCTQYRLPLRDLPRACAERVELLARVVRACPEERDDVLAYQLCRADVATEGEPTVMMRVPRRAAAGMPVAPTWGEAWYGVVAGGLPTDPKAPPDPAEAGKPPFVTTSALEAKKQVIPDFPAEAVAFGSQQCVAAVTIDAAGLPTDVVVEGCPGAFHPTVERTLAKWLWYPPVVDGEARAVRTLVTVSFRMD